MVDIRRDGIWNIEYFVGLASPFTRDRTFTIGPGWLFSKVALTFPVCQSIQSSLFNKPTGTRVPDHAALEPKRRDSKDRSHVWFLPGSIVPSTLFDYFNSLLESVH